MTSGKDTGCSLQPQVHPSCLRRLVPVANTFLTPDDLACYTTLHYDPREMRDGAPLSSAMP